MKVQVFVRLPSDKDVPGLRLTIGNAETVASLKGRLVTLRPLLSLEQDLVFDGAALKDCQRLADCGITNGSELDLVHASATPEAEPVTPASELVKRFSQLLQEQAKQVQVEELALLYAYRFGGSVDEALEACGHIDTSLEAFLSSEKCFCVFQRKVTLSADVTSIERKVQDILQESGGHACCLDILELCVAFGKKHHASLASVAGMKPMDFVERRPDLFTVTGRMVGLTKEADPAPQTLPQLSQRGVLKRALHSVMALLLESCFLCVDRVTITTSAGDKVDSEDEVDAESELCCMVRGLPGVSQDRWLAPLLESVSAVFNERIAAGAPSGEFPLKRVEVSADGVLRFYSEANAVVRVRLAVSEQGADPGSDDSEAAKAAIATTPTGSLSQASTAASCSVSALSTTSSSSPSGGEEPAPAPVEAAPTKWKFQKGDMQLLACFSEICELPEVDGAVAKLLLKAIGMLRRCRYPAEDVCAVLAHAGSYWKLTRRLHPEPMEGTEVGNILILAMYIAHSYTQDEVCPLRTWHRILFDGYCSIKDLNVAITRLLRLWDYRLRVADDELLRHWKSLRQATGAPAEPFAYGGVSRD